MTARYRSGPFKYLRQNPDVTPNAIVQEGFPAKVLKDLKHNLRLGSVSCPSCQTDSVGLWKSPEETGHVVPGRKRTAIAGCPDCLIIWTTEWSNRPFQIEAADVSFPANLSSKDRVEAICDAVFFVDP